MAVAGAGAGVGAEIMIKVGAGNFGSATLVSMLLGLTLFVAAASTFINY